jgi:transcriptional regulator of arginine metabolism
MASTKRKRKGLVLNLIQSREIATQSELLDLLRESGFETTQASLSRDLDELGIEKRAGIYQAPGKPEPAPVGPRFRLIGSGPTLWVLRCAAGQAPSVALTVDLAGLPGIAGTIAGDDTVFIALRSERDSKKVVSALSGLFPLEVSPS